MPDENFSVVPPANAATIVWDRWQRDVLAHRGHMVLRTGRQVGKSQVLSRKVFDFSLENAGTTVLVLAPALRQSSFMLDKILSWFERTNVVALESAINEFKRTHKREPRDAERLDMSLKTTLFAEMPTRTHIFLKNGTKIYSFPAGRTGIFIMGMTLDLLVVDEAAFVPEVVWNNILPMIAVSQKLRGLGYIWLASIPFWKGGFFYDCSHDSDFREFHVSSEDCPRIPKPFLAKKKHNMTKSEYSRIYRGEFVDEYNQLFATELLVRASTFLEWTVDKNMDKTKRYYLGVDIARYGGDENAFVVAELDNGNNIKIVKVQTTNRISTVDTIGRVLDLDKIFNFSRIFIDDAGVGGGVTDVLVEKKGRKIVGLNNASRSVDHAEHRRRILKEDLYSNVVVLLENQKIELINNLDLQKSMKGVVFEYSSEGNLRIHGAYTHIAEAVVRACWCIKDKGLKVYIA